MGNPTFCCLHACAITRRLRKWKVVFLFLYRAYCLLKIVCDLQVAYLTQFMREIARTWPVFKSIVFAQYEHARQNWGEGHL